MAAVLMDLVDVEIDDVRIGVPQLVEVTLYVVIAGIAVSLRDTVLDMVDIQLVRDQAVQSVGIVDTV